MFGLTTEEGRRFRFLNAKEKLVLLLTALGHDDAEIATRASVSVRAVPALRRRAQAKVAWTY